MDDIALMREIARLQNQIDALRTIESGWNFVPLTTPLTSTSWDGNDTVNVGTYTIDTSATFSAPVGIKAAAIYMQATWASVNSGYTLAATYTGSSLSAVLVRSQVANIPMSTSGIVTCDANGDFDLIAANANATNVILRIWGYWK